MDPEAKFELALSIEALGGDYIETGFPASPPSEVEATRLISKGLTTAKFVTFFSDTYLAERGPVAVLAHRSTTAEDGTYRIEADARANGLKMAERHGRSDVPGRERREPR